MRRVLMFAAVLLLGGGATAGQVLGVLRITIAVPDANRQLTPVARHRLLISDNPPSAPPRAVVTRPDGTVEVRLRPGSYLVESDEPVAFQGTAYQWTKRVEVAAEGITPLALTADNADPAPTGTAASLEDDPSFLLPQWQASVVRVWTPTAHASGFFVDERGLIATNQRVVGSAPSVEVQLNPELKVAARVVESSAERDVAILWIDPAVAAPIRSVPLPCADGSAQAVKEGEPIHVLGTPLRGPIRLTTATVNRVEPQGIRSELRLPSGSAGGPAFVAGGRLIGLTSVETDDEERRLTAPVVPVAAACEAVAAAGEKISGPPPSAARLPVEPASTLPIDALEEAARRRIGSLSPPQISSSDFDIAFISPVLTFGAQNLGRDWGQDSAQALLPSDALRPLRSFSNWSEYVEDYPPVLMIRVTPRLVEGFWTMVARGAAMTQGMALPPMKRFAGGFSRLRAFCGDAEVMPIHPFKLEQRVGESDMIHEGLYIFDPDALRPQCGTVRLTLYSEKAPDKGDTRTVDPKILERIRQDFAPYRRPA